MPDPYINQQIEDILATLPDAKRDEYRQAFYQRVADAQGGDVDAQMELMRLGIYVTQTHEPYTIGQAGALTPQVQAPVGEVVSGQSYQAQIPSSLAGAEVTAKGPTEIPNSWWVLNTDKNQLELTIAPSYTAATLTEPEQYEKAQVLSTVSLPQAITSQIQQAEGAMTEYQAASLAQRQSEESRRQTEWQYEQQYGAELENTRNRIQALRDALSFQQEITPYRVATTPEGYIQGFGPGGVGSRILGQNLRPVYVNPNPLLNQLQQIQFSPGAAP